MSSPSMFLSIADWFIMYTKDELLIMALASVDSRRSSTFWVIPVGTPCHFLALFQTVFKNSEVDWFESSRWNSSM